MNADFRVRAFTHNANTPVLGHLLQLLFTHVRKNFRQRLGCAAGRVLLKPMMHLHHFQIKPGAKYFRGLTRQPEKRVYASRIIR